MVAGQIDGNPAAAYSRVAQASMVGSDARFRALPSDSDLARVDPQDLPRILKAPLGGQADVVMVGDVTVDQAIGAVNSSFAAGPAGARIAPAPARVTMPAGNGAPIVAEHNGRADQALYGEYFRLPDYFADPTAGAVGNVAAAIIASRLVDTVREQLGITYSPHVEAVSGTDLAGLGYLGITLETPPANFDKIRALMADQLKDLATKPVSPDELARARQPLIEAEAKKRETNAFWLGKLSEIARDPRLEAEVLTTPARLSAVTTADVQSLIAKVAAGRQPVVIIAKAKAAGVQAASK
jgi:zinc protease